MPSWILHRPPHRPQSAKPPLVLQRLWPLSPVWCADSPVVSRFSVLLLLRLIVVVVRRARLLPSQHLRHVSNTNILIARSYSQSQHKLQKRHHLSLSLSATMIAETAHLHNSTIILQSLHSSMYHNAAYSSIDISGEHSCIPLQRRWACVASLSTNICDTALIHNTHTNQNMDIKALSPIHLFSCFSIYWQIPPCLPSWCWYVHNNMYLLVQMKYVGLVR